MTGTTIRPRAADPTDRYVAAFEAFERGFDGTSAPPLRALRCAALESFRRLGFPTARDEAWKGVDLSRITESSFAVPEAPCPEVSPAEAARFLFDGLEGVILAFVDGRPAPALSAPGPLPDGVTVTSLAAALAGGDERILEHLARHADAEALPFTALNTAFLRDGAYVHVPRNVAVGLPVRILHLSSGRGGTVSHPRNLIVSEAGSRVTVVETYGGLEGGTVLTNAVTEIVAGEGAEVDHLRPGLEAPDAIHVGNVHIEQEAGSRVTSHSVTLGGAFVRNDVTVILGGEAAESRLDGFYFPEGEQHVDNYTTIRHERPDCPSHERYKGILGGRSRAIFRGRIHVHPGAAGTDAYQSNQNLLLSDEARVDTKPQLEIYADEVRCSHGATVGQLDDDAFFYLRSRGIGVADARRILLQAFAAEVIGRIGPVPVREAIDRRVREKFERIEERTEEDQ